MPTDQPAPAAPSFIVTRFGPGKTRKTYGPFDDRETANRVALRAIEKHVGAVVSVDVEPVARVA